ncbi:unnamed protein product, partial [marine sediment metagenome]
MNIQTKEKALRYFRDSLVSYLLVSERTCSSKQLTTTLVEVEPQEFQRLHSHVPEQMYFMLSGNGEMTVSGETCMVNEGDSIFIPSNEKHGLMNTGNTKLRYLSAAAPSFEIDTLNELWPNRS